MHVEYLLCLGQLQLVLLGTLSNPENYNLPYHMHNYTCNEQEAGNVPLRHLHTCLVASQKQRYCKSKPPVSNFQRCPRTPAGAKQMKKIIPTPPTHGIMRSRIDTRPYKLHIYGLRGRKTRGPWSSG